MSVVLEINDLEYKDFHQIDLSFENKTYYSMIGPNNCGKTILFKLISGIILSNDNICCNGIFLNKESINKYIVNFGIVNRVSDNSFAYQKVIDEMMYPLYNLGYAKNTSLKRITEILELFQKSSMKDKYISELSFNDKQILLLMIAILHKPKVLLLDGVLEVFSKSERKKIIEILKEIKSNGMTIISFTNSLEEACESDKIILLDNFKIIGEYKKEDIYKNDKLFYEHHLEIPFLIDLSVKLKMYNIVNKEYRNMKEMVDDIWP